MTPSGFAAVLFDLDGTLLDTAADFATALERLADEAGTTPPDTVRLHQTVSAGARALVTLTLGLQPEEPDFDHWLERLLQLYGEQLATPRSTLYEGLDRSLQRLDSAGVPWGVVTNKPERYTRPLLEGLGLQSRCAVTICPDQVTRTKPDPEPLTLACRHLACSPARTLYVGDHPRDIEAGVAAGMITAVAGWGYLPAGSDPAHWGADRILDRTQDLLQWLEAGSKTAP